LKNKIKVLIVEDDLLNSYLISKILEMQDRFEYLIASNGNEAIKLMVSNNFDIILMDLNVPDMNGIDITRIIRKANIKIPIIAMTGDVREKVIAGCHNAGMNGFISKPFAVTELISKIDNYLDYVKSNRINFSDFAEKMIS